MPQDNNYPFCVDGFGSVTPGKHQNNGSDILEMFYKMF
jgi:hypothetical protein